MSSKEKKSKKGKDTEKSVKSGKSSKSGKSKEKDKSVKSKSKSKSKDKSETKSKVSSKSPAREDPTAEEQANQLNNNLLGSTNQLYGMNPYNTGSPQPFNIQGNSLLASRQDFHGNQIGGAGEKCDGCFEGEGVTYCKQCEKLLCNICDNQIHVIPAYRNHERIGLEEMGHLKKLCYHHNLSLKYYCESCDEPICQQCQLVGPHNTKLHRITNLMDAYKTRYDKLNKMVEGSLLPKYEQITNNIKIIDSKVAEVEKNAETKERDINISYNKMLEFLYNEKGKKLAILNYESANYQKDLVMMDDIINTMKDTKNDTNTLLFLLRYHQLNEDIEHLISKPISLKLDNDITTIKSEFTNQQFKIDNYQKMVNLLKLKDDIIWQLLQGNNKKSSSLGGSGIGGVGGSNLGGNMGGMSNLGGMGGSIMNSGVPGTGLSANNFGVGMSGNMSGNNRYGGIGGGILGGSVGNSGRSGIIKPSRGKELASLLIYNINNYNVNFYQVVCEFAVDDKMEKITYKEIPSIFKKLGVEVLDKEVDDVLKVFGIKDKNKININEFSRNVAMFSSQQQ